MAEATFNISETVKEFYSYLKNYISKNVSNSHIAEDLTQEVMYRLAKADGEGHHIRNVKAWLFQTTRHVIADYYRKQDKSPIAKYENSFPTVSMNQHVTKTQESAFLIPMINLLPEKYNRPLLMSDIEGLPQKEIANILNIGLSATKMRILRARKKLHNLFTCCCHIEFNAEGDFAACTIKDQCDPLFELKNELCDAC